MKCSEGVVIGQLPERELTFSRITNVTTAKTRVSMGFLQKPIMGEVCLAGVTSSSDGATTYHCLVPERNDQPARCRAVLQNHPLFIGNNSLWQPITTSVVQTTCSNRWGKIWSSCVRYRDHPPEHR